MRTVRATGAERRLGPEELIVTKTDLQGRITYANGVFLRISALTEDAALGRPHNLIRDPEMPRGLFHRLWRTLESGEEMFAYIRNLAADGVHYWVLAHVTPSIDAAGRVVGHHSNRRAPTRSALPVVLDAYARMREAERGLSRREAGAAGDAALTALLEERGLTHDQWLWSLEAEEVA